jgi:hypothetical protein
VDMSVRGPWRHETLEERLPQLQAAKAEVH